MFDEILYAIRKTKMGKLDHGLVEQAGSAGSLFAGHFEGISTVEEEFSGSILGLGVMGNLNGEVVSVNGETWAIPASGIPFLVAGNKKIAFGISAHGGIKHHFSIPAGSNLETLTVVIDKALESLHTQHEDIVAAIRIKGSFNDVVLRTVHQPDYLGEKLGEVIDDEIRFSFDNWEGTLVGFYYPDDSSGITIPGLHLHGIASNHKSGGHVRNATLLNVSAEIWLDDLSLHSAADTKSDADAIDFQKYEGSVEN